MRHYYVYMVMSYSGVLYIGVTNDLARRMDEHRAGTTPGSTSKYRANKLVFAEVTDDIYAALTRERYAVFPGLSSRRVSLP